MIYLDRAGACISEHSQVPSAGMATITAPNRTIVAILFLVGGALQALGAIVGLANVGNSGGFYLLSNLALGAAFVAMMAWLATSTVARIGYAVAAVGWLLLALAGLLNLGPVGTFAVFVAIIGSVFAGVLVMITRPFAGDADVLLLVALIVGALNLLLTQFPGVPALVLAVIVIVFGVLLVLAALRMLGKRITP